MASPIPLAQDGDVALDPDGGGASRKPSRMRWAIAAMLFLAAILNYIDRQTLSILAPMIQRDLSLNEEDYASITNYFLIAYTASLLLSGRLIDKLGTRLSMALFVGWWSIANVLTGFARSFASLGATRFLLGLGEAGNWPGSAKTVAEWFPAKERGLAIGIYTMGATLGATIAPILITAIVFGSGGTGADPARHWQWAFVATGLLGLLWVVPWLIISRPRAGNAQAVERADAAAAGAASATVPEATDAGGSVWLAVLRRSDVWVLMIGRMLTDPVWYFYQFWFAKYLFSARGVPQEQLGITWVIFLAADVGSIAGGLASGLLIRRGRGVVGARLAVMLACACIAPLSLFVHAAPTVGLSLLIAMAIVLAHLSWLVNITALVVDVIPKRLVGTAFGVIAAGSAVGGIMMNKAIGHYLERAQVTASVAPATPGTTTTPAAGQPSTRPSTAVAAGSATAPVVADVPQVEGSAAPPATAPAGVAPAATTNPAASPAAVAATPGQVARARSTYGAWFLVAAVLHPVAWLLLYAWHRMRGDRNAAAPAAAA